MRRNPCANVLCPYLCSLSTHTRLSVVLCPFLPLRKPLQPIEDPLQVMP
jgi:hypothetical protein